MGYSDLHEQFHSAALSSLKGVSYPENTSGSLLGQLQCCCTTAPAASTGLDGDSFNISAKARSDAHIAYISLCSSSAGLKRFARLTAVAHQNFTIYFDHLGDLNTIGLNTTSPDMLSVTLLNVEALLQV